MASPPLFALHPELLLSVVDRLTALRDLGSLVLTCRSMHDQLSPVLYRHAWRIEPGLLPWAAGEGGCKTATVLKLLAAGADPFFQQVRGKNYYPYKPGHRPWANAVELFDNQLICPLQPLPSNACPPNPEDPASPRAGATQDIELRGSASGWRRFINSEKDYKDMFAESTGLRGYYYMGWSAIHVAAVKGRVDTLKVLLGHDAHNGGKLIDNLAAGYCSLDEVHPAYTWSRTRVYEEALPRMRQRGLPQTRVWTLHTPLRAAICARREDTAIFLIKNGAKLKFGPGPNGEHDHALHVAAFYGCHRVIKHIVAQYPDVNMDLLDRFAWTPLCNAIASQFPADTVSCLIELGADANASLRRSDASLQNDNNDDGFTHLHLACWRRQWAHARTLLNAGAEVEPVYRPIFEHAPLIGVPALRAVDLVCTDTNTESLNTGNFARHDTHELMANIEERDNFLASLIRDYNANTGPCPGLPSSLVTIAATNPFNPLGLLNALRDGGLYFHDDGDLIANVLEIPPTRHLGSYNVIVMLEVVLWLLRHGARVGEKSYRNLSERLWVIVDLARDMKNPHDFLDRLGHVLQALVKKGGMDADIPSARLKPGEKYGECSLYRTFLRDPNPQISIALGQALADAGARRLDVMTAVKDFEGALPPMTQWEIRDLVRQCQNFKDEAGEEDTVAEEDRDDAHHSYTELPRPGNEPDQEEDNGADEEIDDNDDEDEDDDEESIHLVDPEQNEGRRHELKTTLWWFNVALHRTLEQSVPQGQTVTLPTFDELYHGLFDDFEVREVEDVEHIVSCKEKVESVRQNAVSALKRCLEGLAGSGSRPNQSALETFVDSIRRLKNTVVESAIL